MLSESSSIDQIARATNRPAGAETWVCEAPYVRIQRSGCRIQRNLLRGARPKTIPAKTFDVDNDNATIFTNHQDFAASLQAAVDTMLLQGYRTFKAGSCLADNVAERSSHAAHYSDEHFFRAEAIIVPVLIQGGIEGAAAETRAINLPNMVNVRLHETRSSNEPWTAARPGIIYIVPTRYETVAAFKSNHLSRYKKIQMQLPTKSAVPRPGNTSNHPEKRGKYNMKKKPRKKYTQSGAPRAKYGSKVKTPK